VSDQFKSLFVCPNRERVEHLLGNRFRIELGRLQLRAAALNLGEVEDAVDELEQGVPLAMTALT
jgi:hypothetical protein